VVVDSKGAVEERVVDTMVADIVLKARVVV